jgi:tetratricopeptide (TPR) repeat protein
VVEQAWRMFDEDPEGALRILEDARQGRAPNPAVLHALCRMYGRRGQLQDAVEVAREALPRCLDGGYPKLAAEVFVTVAGRARDLDPGPQRAILLAEAVEKTGDLRSTVQAFAAALRVDPDEVRAIKGMLRAAEALHRKEGARDDAIKVYRYLVAQCPRSPLTALARERLSEIA